MSKIARIRIEQAGGGVIIGPGARTVAIGNIPISLFGDIIQAHPPCPDNGAHCVSQVIQGSHNVFCEGKQVTRIGDGTSCGHPISGIGQKVNVNG